MHDDPEKKEKINMYISKICIIFHNFLNVDVYEPLIVMRLTQDLSVFWKLPFSLDTSLAKIRCICEGQEDLYYRNNIYDFEMTLAKTNAFVVF